MSWTNVKLIFLRELRDQLRDRRTLFTIVVLPVLLYPLLGMCFLQVHQFLQEHSSRVRIVGAENLPAEPPLLVDGKIAPALADDHQRRLLELEVVAASDSNASKLRIAAQRDIDEGLCDLIVCFPADFAARLDQFRQASADADAGPAEGAGDIPVYANAAIFDPGKTARDNDLNGFIFADTPALLEPSADASALRGDLQTYWPQRAGLARAYAMGFDAYGLVASLFANDGTALSMHGLSGDLSLDAQGRVRRELPLAQFRSGRPVALDDDLTRSDGSRGLIGQR